MERAQMRKGKRETEALVHEGDNMSYYGWIKNV
jgi:hypothetical protein